MPSNTFRVLHLDAGTGKGRFLDFGDRAAILGGSGLAAALYQEYGLPEEDAYDPRQPLIFAIGPLTGYYPLMSKVVCAFKSPYNNYYAESHAGGRLGLTLRFAGIDALMVTGKAPTLSALAVGSNRIDRYDVHYLKGKDVYTAGKMLRRLGRETKRGHRSIIRIGPAGENGSAYACINVDSYRHFGRLGAGGVMGMKNVKAILVQGDAVLPLPQGKEYPALFKEIHKQLTATDMMRKYHDLGTPANLIPLNELKSLPWRNLQATTDPGVESISGERFAEQLLLRQAACSGCPIGCIHIGLLRFQYASQHEYLYRQVNYDYECIFAQGTMLGIREASDVLAILDETEKVGLDVMSAGVALAWATEAFQKGVVTEKETLTPLEFNNVSGYLEAIQHLGSQPNEFYRLLAQGTLVAAKHFGGEDYACVLGQEMAGYATGETFFTAQALSFRHSHLDTGGYSYDQKHAEQDAEGAVNYLMDDEVKRIKLCCMVGCLFSRNIYTDERLGQALEAMGMADVSASIDDSSRAIRAHRLKLKAACGWKPEDAHIPKRFREVATWKGEVDPAYLENLKNEYIRALRAVVDE